jgi:hypothetical protein
MTERNHASSYGYNEKGVRLFNLFINCEINCYDKEYLISVALIRTV